MNRYLEAIYTTPLGLSVVDNPFNVLMHILGLSSGEETIYQLPHGIQLAVPNKKPDRSTIMTVYEVFGKMVYPVPLTGPGAENLNVIDLGAQAGIFALYCALKNPQAQIYCYEPEAGNFAQLLRNCQINDKLAQRITVNNTAVMADCGSVELFLDRLSSRVYSTVFSGEGLGKANTSSVTVEAVNLKAIFDQLKLDHCDLLKIDVEGAEYQILYNCPSEILARIDLLYVECHQRDFRDKSYTLPAMKSFLSENSFSITGQRGNVLQAKRML